MEISLARLTDWTFRPCSLVVPIYTYNKRFAVGLIMIQCYPTFKCLEPFLAILLVMKAKIHQAGPPSPHAAK